MNADTKPLPAATTACLERVFDTSERHPPRRGSLLSFAERFGRHIDDPPPRGADADLPGEAPS